MKYPSATISIGLGDRLAQLRALKGLSQADIVQGDLSRAYVSAVERGRITPSLQALELIAARLGEPVSVLLGEQATTAQGLMPSNAVLSLERTLFELVTTSKAPANGVPGLDSAEMADLGPEGELLHFFVTGRVKLALGDGEGAVQAARDGLTALLTTRRVGRELWHMWLEALQGHGYLTLGQPSNAADLFADLAHRAGGGSSGEAMDVSVQLSAQVGLLTAYRHLSHHDRASDLSNILASRLPSNMVSAGNVFYSAKIGSPSSGQAQSGPWSPRLNVAKLMEHVRLCSLAWQEIALNAQRQNHTEQAETALARSVDLAEMCGAWEQASQAVNLLAAQQLDAGKLDAASAMARRGLGLAERQNSASMRGQALATLAKVAAARNESADALKLFSDAVAQLEKAGSTSPKEMSDVFFSYGRLLVAQGRVDEGAKMLERAYVAQQTPKAHS